MRMKVACVLLLSVLSIDIIAQPGNYRSRQSGQWTDNQTWERDADLNGTFEENPANVAPVIAITAGAINIQNSHVISTDIDITADQVTIENGGSLVIPSGIIYTVNDGPSTDLILQSTGFLSVSGTISKNSTAVISGTSVTNTVFLNGSRYRHLNTTSEGSIPVAIWDANATLEVAGFTSERTLASNTWSQNFGNVEWNCTAQASSIRLNGLITSIQGDFTVLSTNGAPLQLAPVAPTVINVGGNFSVYNNSRLYYTTNGNITLNIGGDFIYNSTNVNGSFFSSTGQATANIARDFIMNAPGGTLYVGASSPSSGLSTFNIDGDFTLTAGRLLENGTSSQCIINFNNGATHNLTNTGNITGTFDYLVGVNDHLIIAPDSYIGGIDGSGVTSDFVMNGTLTVQSADVLGAIRNATTRGNIRTSPSTRVYGPGSTIIYTNPFSAQTIGDGHPSESPAVNLVIQNPLGVGYASNVNSLTVTGDLILTEGALQLVSSTSAKTLTIAGNVSSTGGTISSSGPNNDILVTGSGNVVMPFLAGHDAVRNLTVNKSANNPSLSSDLTVSGTLNLVSGNLVFNDRTLTLRGSVTYGTGLLASNSASTLVINGPSFSSAGLLSFDPSANTLGTLIISRRAGFVTATINSPLIVSNTLNLAAGNLTNSAGLQMGNGSTIIRTSIGALLGSRPVNLPGQSWNVTYSGSTTTTGPELPEATDDEDLNNLTINSGPVTLSQDIIINGSLNLNGSTLNLATFNLVMEGTGWNDNGGTITFNSNPIVFNGVNSTIGGSSLTQFRNVQVNSGATVTLPGETIVVRENIVVDPGGAFDANNGTLILNGATLQTISANGATLHNITVDKPSGLDVVLLSNLNITGRLYVQSADSDFASNGFLTIISTSDSDFGNGSIGPLVNHTTVSGDVTVQRYWNAEGTNNRYISSPITNATVSQLQDDFFVTGPFSESSFSTCGPFPCLNDGYSLKYYDETTLGPINKGYRGYPQSNVSEMLQPGRGYLANMWDESSETWDVTGPINQGAINFSISHTPSTPADPGADGWNLVGNPYPSSIIWDNSEGWVRNQIAPIAYVPDLSSGPPGVFRISNFNVPNAGDLTNDVIATAQSFWVYANEPGASMSVNEQAKTITTGVFYRKKSSKLFPVLTISLTFGTVTDNSFIVLHPDATYDYDIELDGYKLEGEELSVAILNDQSKFVLYAVPELAEEEIIPLAVKTLNPGKYQLSINAKDGFDLSGWQMYDRLKDQYFKPETVYVFDSYENVQDRFYLIKGNGRIFSEGSAVVVFPNPASEYVTVRLPEGEDGTIYLLDSLGKVLAIQNAEGGIPVRFSAGTFTAGMYLIKIKTQSYTSIKKLIKK